MQHEITDQGAWLDWMEIGALDASEIEETLDIVARGMRDNPLTVAVFGDSPEQRRQRLYRFMAGQQGRWAGDLTCSSHEARTVGSQVCAT